MAIIAPSFIPKYNPTADMWGGISDIFGDLTRMKQDAYQRQRQEAADARAVTSAQSVERNRQQLYDQRAAQMAEYEAALARDAAEREKIAANRLSPRDFAREATIANARQPIPTLPSNFDQYPGEQGRQPSPTMFGYKGPTEYDRNVARANMMRGVTSDEALTWKRLEDAASTIAKREQDATKAFHQGQIDEVTFNKLSVQLSREKQALDQARKEAQFEINKKRDDARWGKTRADQSDFNLQRDQKLDWAQSVLSDTDKPAYKLEGAPQLGYPHRVARASQIPEDFGLYGGTTKERELQKARDIFSVYGNKKDPTVADAVTRKTIPDTMSKKQHRDSLATTMLEEIKARPDYHEKAFDKDEISRAQDNILRAARQIAIASGDSSLDNQWKIAYILSKNFNSGFKKGEMLDKPGFRFGFGGDYQDYTPMSTNDIVNAYKKGTPQGNQNNVAVPPEVTARYNQLKAAGKGRSEIERILRSEGLIE